MCEENKIFRAKKKKFKEYLSSNPDPQRILQGKFQKEVNFTQEYMENS